MGLYIPDHVRKHIADNMKGYTDFELFDAEYGWVEWMNEYTNAIDDEIPLESELNIIENILKSVWDEMHE